MWTSLQLSTDSSRITNNIPQSSAHMPRPPPRHPLPHPTTSPTPSHHQPQDIISSSTISLPSASQQTPSERYTADAPYSPDTKKITPGNMTPSATYIGLLRNKLWLHMITRTACASKNLSMDGSPHNSINTSMVQHPQIYAHPQSANLPKLNTIFSPAAAQVRPHTNKPSSRPSPLFYKSPTPPFASPQQSKQGSDTG